MSDKENIMKKLSGLNDISCSMKSILVAYSGGVDSTFLLKAAKYVLGKNVLAVTSDSPTITSEE